MFLKGLKNVLKMFKKCLGNDNVLERFLKRFKNASKIFKNVSEVIKMILKCFKIVSEMIKNVSEMIKKK